MSRGLERFPLGIERLSRGLERFPLGIERLPLGNREKQEIVLNPGEIEKNNVVIEKNQVEIGDFPLISDRFPVVFSICRLIACNFYATNNHFW